jgi:carboxylesterase
VEVPTARVVPGSGDLACLLIHGLTGSPVEMAPVAERLVGRYPLFVVRVAGHETTPEDLARTSWRDWYHSAEAGLEALLAVRSRLVVIGLSMGALLAMRLAIEYTRSIEGLVLLSPAMQVRRIHGWVRTPVELAAALDERSPLARRLLSAIAFPKHGSDIADPEVRRRHPGYRRVPLRALLNLQRLQRDAQAHARVITQPTLVVHALQDHTCPVAAAEAMYESLASHDKRLVLLHDSFHVVTVDRERARVLDEIDAFVNGHAPQPVTSST